MSGFLKNSPNYQKKYKIGLKKLVFEELLTDNLFELGYMERMKGYPDKYKIRIGDYRMGITIR